MSPICILLSIPFVGFNYLLSMWIFWCYDLDLSLPAFFLSCVLTIIDGFVLDWAFKRGKKEVL